MGPNPSCRGPERLARVPEGYGAVMTSGNEAEEAGHGLYGGTGSDQGGIQEEPDAAEDVDESWAEKTETGGEAS